MQQQFEDYFVDVEKLYRKQYQGVGGIISFILRKRNPEIKKQFKEGENFRQILVKEVNLLERLKSLPEEITYEISQEETHQNEMLKKMSIYQKIVVQ